MERYFGIDVAGQGDVHPINPLDPTHVGNRVALFVVKASDEATDEEVKELFLAAIARANENDLIIVRSAYDTEIARFQDKQRNAEKDFEFARDTRP